MGDHATGSGNLSDYLFVGHDCITGLVRKAPNGGVDSYEGFQVLPLVGCLGSSFIYNIGLWGRFRKMPDINNRLWMAFRSYSERPQGVESRHCLHKTDHLNFKPEPTRLARGQDEPVSP